MAKLMPKEALAMTKSSGVNFMIRSPMDVWQEGSLEFSCRGIAVGLKAGDATHRYFPHQKHYSLQIHPRLATGGATALFVANLASRFFLRL